jgi:hypothetical protein
MWMADSHNGNAIQQAFPTFVAVNNLFKFEFFFLKINMNFDFRQHDYFCERSKHFNLFPEWYIMLFPFDQDQIYDYDKRAL